VKLTGVCVAHSLPGQGIPRGWKESARISAALNIFLLSSGYRIYPGISGSRSMECLWLCDVRMPKRKYPEFLLAFTKERLKPDIGTTWITQ